MTTSRAKPATPGFTLLEVVIALAIVGALLTIAFGGLRVALSAWTRGEDRAAVHQHARALAGMLARTIESAYPYRAADGDAPDPVLLFDGRTDRLSLVTTAAPVPLAPTIAFTAVRLGFEEGGEPALAIHERPLPNRDVFTEARPVLRDPSVTALAFRYLAVDGNWRDSWDGPGEDSLPVAVELTVTTSMEGRLAATIPITVAIRTAGVQP